MANLTRLEYFAGHALAGVLSSPSLSDSAYHLALHEHRINEEMEYFHPLIARIAWNVAEAMVKEGKVRGHIPTEAP